MGNVSEENRLDWRPKRVDFSCNLLTTKICFNKKWWSVKATTLQHYFKRKKLSNHY